MSIYLKRIYIQLNRTVTSTIFRSIINYYKEYTVYIMFLAKCSVRKDLTTGWISVKRKTSKYRSERTKVTHIIHKT